MNNNTSSINKFRWRLFKTDERQIAMLTQKFDISDIIAKIICVYFFRHNQKKIF